MKRFNLISILILLISFVGVQSVAGQTQVADGVWLYNGNYYTICNESWEYYDISGDGNKKRNKTYNFNYPSNILTFHAKLSAITNTTKNINISSCSLSETISINKNGTNKSYDINNKDCRYIKFSSSDSYVKNVSSIYLEMAPHIILAESNSKIDFGSIRYDAGAITATIKIKSCLSDGGLSTNVSNSTIFTLNNEPSTTTKTFYSIDSKEFSVTFDPSKVTFKDNENTTSINDTITISDSGNSTNKITITLTASVNRPKTQTITWNQTFHNPLRVGDTINIIPATINSENTITYKSNNNNAVIENDKIIIKATDNISISASHPGDSEWQPANVTKTATAYQYNVSTPTQDEVAYKYIKLSWNAIHEADSYSIYDDATKKHILTTKETNCIIKNLTSDSTYNFIIKTNDAQSINTTSTGTQFSVKTKQFPLVKNLQLVGEPSQNQVTIKWDHADLLPNHELVEYLIHVYKEGNTIAVGYDPDQNTSHTITNLTDSTNYRIYVGVQYRQKLDGAEYHSFKGGEWVYLDVTTKSFLPAEDELNDAIKYRDEWYRVHINKIINISSNTAATAKDKVHTMYLDYPCEPKIEFQINTSEVLNIYGKANIKIDECLSENCDNPTRIHAESYSGLNQSGTANTSGHNVKALQFYCDGGANSDEYVHDIWLKIAPHIRLNNNGASVSNITVTCPDVYYDEAEEGSSIDVDFFSFLTDPNEAMTYSVSGDSKNFTVAIPTTTKNDFCHKDDNIKKVSIKFNPTVGDYHKKVYNATITLKSGSQTATIEVSAKGLKHEHKLTWKNDFPTEILVGDNIDAPAYMSVNGCNDKYTHPTIKYSDTNALFSQIEGYNYITAKKEGTTTLVARIDGTNYCEGDTITREVGVKDVEPTMSWSQNLIFVESSSEREVILSATSNKAGNIIYAINGTDTDNIVKKIEGNKLYINANVVGSVHLKAYNEYHTDAIATNTLIVTSASDCNTTYSYSNTIYISTVGAEKETTIELQYPAKSISFYADMGTTVDFGSLKSQYTITVKDENGEEFLSSTEYEDKTIIVPLSETVKKVTIVAKSTWTSSLEINNITTTLHSSFDNYKITTAISNNTIDFGRFDMGAGAQAKAQTINLSYHSLPGGITFEIDGDANIFTLDKNLIDNTCAIGNGSVIVTCNPLRRGTHTAYLVIKTGGEEKKRIKLQATVKGVSQSIVWTTETLTTVDRDVAIAKTNADLPVSLEIVGGNNDIVETTNNGLTIWVKNKGSFTITASHPGSDTYEPISENKTFNSIIGTLRFDKDGEWSNISNWLPVSNLNKQRNVEPSAVVNAVMTAEAVISNAERNEINNLTFKTGGKLTIESTSGLKANAVSEATATNLTLEASAEGNAAFTYASGAPSATVMMHSKASGGVANGTPQWQYMGVAVSGAKAGDFKKDGNQAWLLKWEEKDNVTGDPWSDKPLAAETTLAPWAGYSITQPQATTYTMSGQLMNSNQTYTLTRTINEGAEKQDADCGFNLLANSYTAPIDITKLTEKDFVNADACIVLYNTGTYADWHLQQGSSGEQAGQLTVIPVETVGATDLPKTIPSMQAFFVMAKDGGGTFTVNYETAVLGATNRGNQMRAPEARDEFNVLKIMIEGENTRDRLFLLENKNTTNEYDNGYEARKIFDAPRGHQMYATCQYGYASIDCSESFIGQTIGLKGDSEGEQLTISFDTDRLEYYNSLYLYDKATGKYVNIMAGEKYTFFGIKGADDNRFSIVTNPDDENQTPPFVVIGEELAFDKSQIDTDNANIYIYDTSGRLLITDKINPYENYNIPNMPKGIYLVSMNGHTTKIVKK